MEQDTFINFIRTQPCVICGALPVDADHIKTRGAGGGDDQVWPLCRLHHTERHSMGIKTFQSRYDVDSQVVLGQLRRLYQRAVESGRWPKRR